MTERVARKEAAVANHTRWWSDDDSIAFSTLNVYIEYIKHIKWHYKYSLRL